MVWLHSAMIGGEEGGGDTWQYLALFVYYLYIAFVSSCAWHTAHGGYQQQQRE